METVANLNDLQSLAAASATTAQVFTADTVTPVGTHKLVKGSRASKGKEVPESERVRIAFVPEGPLLIDAGAVPTKYAQLLQDTIHDLAKARFVAMLKQAPLLREIPIAAFTISALLEWTNAERESSKVTKPAILEWLKTSETLKALSLAKQTVWLAKIPQLALGTDLVLAAFTHQQAASIISQLSDADCEHAIGQFILARCNLILETEELADSL
jgi:hypothetical protein